MGGQFITGWTVMYTICVIIAFIIQALESRFRILICCVFRDVLFFCNIHVAQRVVLNVIVESFF